ncbi:MAG: NUDIX hydrolase [Candidatus Saccharibacteria bacterium]
MAIDDVRKLKGRLPGFIGHENYFKSAVLLPLVEYQGELCVLFEVRSFNLNVQPGEISYPGGRIEKSDGGPENAAVRETSEELGLKADDIEVIVQLDTMLTPFNVAIYAFVGHIKDHKLINPNPDEVDHVFYVPVSYLMKYEPIERNVGVKMVMPDDYPYHLIPNGRNYPWREGFYQQFFYQYEDKVIWGLTARILNHFIALLKGMSK